MKYINNNTKITVAKDANVFNRFFVLRVIFCCV